MSATAKFYTGVAIALAVVICVSFALGYRAGFDHARAVHGTQSATRH